MSELKSLTVNGKTYQIDDQDITAQVGQTIVVKAVDENGKPTEWEAADIPIIARFFSNDGGASIWCGDYTHRELSDFIASGKVVIAHVFDVQDPRDLPRNVRIYFMNFGLYDQMSNVGDMGSYGWNHYENETGCFADGNIQNTTPGNELWNEF